MKSILKEWIVWVLVIGICGYSFLALLHSALTVDRFKDNDKEFFDDSSPSSNSSTSFPVFSSKDDHLFWFVQLSDIHISKFYDPGRGKDLASFCRDWLPVIRPKVVLVTGDLTDAKDVDFIGSEQYIEEWKEYYAAISTCPVIESKATEWLDLRGNHDAFDLPSISHPKNYYREYSIRGRLNASSYIRHLLVDGVKYSLIAVDFAPSPGPKRPYNFFGILDDEKVSEIESLQREARESRVKVYFGHYPTSTVISTGRRDVTELMKDGLAYLSGHLHTAYGWVPAMHVIQDSGTLELEAGDWRDDRRVRILALDHGLLSFTDQSMASGFPLVVITNPKHAQYLTPTKEPIKSIFYSTHVRILAFSDVPIALVTVYVDDVFLGKAVRASENGPLHVVPWNPQTYSPGTHFIEVRVEDAKGRTRKLNQPFSTHGHSHLEFRFINRLILLSDISVILKTLFFLLFSLLFFPLLLFRFRPSAFSSIQSVAHGSSGIFPCSNPSSSSSSCIPPAPFPLNIPLSLFVLILRSLYIITFSNPAFFALLGVLIYMLVGPWFVAYLTHEQLGFVFLHGITVAGRYLPMNTTYGSGIGHLLFFLLPFSVHLGRCLESRFQSLLRKSSSSIFLPRVFSFFLSHWFSLLFFAYHFSASVFRASPYGICQVALAPVKTWFFFVALALVWKAKTCSISDFRKEALEFGLDGGLAAASTTPRARDTNSISPPKFVD